MPWTYAKPPAVAKRWTRAQQRACVDAANAVISETGDDGAAILACIHAAGKTKNKPRHLALQENIRTRRKAAIKRASKAARRDMRRLDREAIAALTTIYGRARSGLLEDIRQYADGSGSLRLEVLQDLLAQVQRRLNVLSRSRDGLIDDVLGQAAELGVAAFTSDSALIGTSLAQVADEAVQFVRSFVAEDGLQLSDRLWRMDRGAREVVTEAIERAVIQGHSASRAAQDLLAQGIAVPKDLVDKQGAASAERVGRAVSRGLLVTEGNPYDAAKRVMRTEINRAHGEAYQAAAFEHPDVIGTRFLLSPNHPRADICDMHARVNRWGLGPGVYPKGKNPWPAHPNTLSFVEAVFADEVSEADRKGKTDRISWLKEQTASVQEAVLGGRRKRAALARGVLTENEIATPWRVLKKRYERRGLVPERWIQAPATPSAKVPTDNEQAARWAGAWDTAPPPVLSVINRYPAPNALPAEDNRSAYHVPNGGIMMGKRLKPDTQDGRRAWRHEYGHYIDNRLGRDQSIHPYLSNSAAGEAAVLADDKLWKDRRQRAYRTMRTSSEFLQEKYPARFSEARYKALRWEWQSKQGAELVRQARDRFGELTPATARQSVLKIIDEHFEGRDDLWGRLWQYSQGNEQWRQSYGQAYRAAAQIDDLATLAEMVPPGHDSYVNIMDLVGSITLEKTGRGHGLSYYKAWPHRRAAEAFANVFDLLSYATEGDEEDVLETFAPSFTDFVREAIR